MDKNQIRERIYSCDTEDDIKQLVEERIYELEQNSEEETIGQGYTDIFKDFISSKVHYKPAAKFGDIDCPDLLYDDINDYINLVEELRKNSYYNFTTLFSTIFFMMEKELKTGDKMDRYFLYSKNKDFGRVSIKEIKDFSCAFCSERAGMSHNMFKFLGLDSQLISGTRDGINHAYNIVFPNGYDHEPAVLFDPSFHIDYINHKDQKISFGYFIPLTKDKYDKMLLGETVLLDLEKSSEKLNNLYSLNERFSDYELCNKSCSYGIGINNTKDNRKVL